ncbi:OLC1v1000623C1 [Oldenlandia corymbosa var. corymbosa]|uniref:OLC1v1000623C1 n=1 Tax=Oldenlandia corymbosa var. corymbosa TaxID=529605 RepID=A0AAV1D477_OLDCO|nr:OLC1v1000623C1 [Oldenlandia corymbosa var. corymbosa]
MWIKLRAGDSAGVVTAFYRRSGDHALDKVDFEFLGNRPGENISIQANVFANGHGNREQKLVLPFDPTADYRDYKIIWNPHIIMMYIDGVPIRMFKNNTAIEVDYTSKAMQILASIWNQDYWATNGGRTKIDWSHAPFSAQFRRFDVDGCSSSSTQDQDCASTKYWWNGNKFWELEEGSPKLWYKALRTLITYVKWESY